MKTSPIIPEDFSASVIAVPPLARHMDLSLNQGENTELIHHLETNGIRTFVYGGNANFYHLPVTEYQATLEFLAGVASANSWIIPSAGPDYGRLKDQADILRELNFPAVMVLPQIQYITPTGVEVGLRQFAERSRCPLLIYLKSEEYMSPGMVGRLVDEGLVCGVKYAIERPDTKQDDYLRELLECMDCRNVVSGMGERPAIIHMRDFQLSGFTSGSACIAPKTANQFLEALKIKAYDRAENLRCAFLPLEDLRDTIGPVRVLHDAVTFSGIANMGPMLPMLSNLESEHKSRVQAVVNQLIGIDNKC